MNELKKTAKDPNLIYDVGLQSGQDTDYYLKKGYRVIAFEANPDSVEFCRNRFKGEIAEDRLEIVEGAITENVSSNGRPAEVGFYRNNDHALWSTACNDWASRNEVLGTKNDLISVPAVDFEQCLEKYGIPHYLKADIVGSETICLRALLKFENKPDYISIRSEKLVFRKLEYEFELLEQLGYSGFKAVKQDFEKVRPQLPSTNGLKFHEFEEGASGPFGEETAGTWKSSDKVLNDYRRIFVRYWLFGDYSYLIQTQNGKRMIAHLERIFRRSIPGWFDTHARFGMVSAVLGSFSQVGQYLAHV
ncbi:MAG: FkbM family methyltransferase [Chloracidobacterium sp.]|nr:FkbM family methyltransferase [Chloracidobacterium sp.]